MADGALDLLRLSLLSMSVVSARHSPNALDIRFRLDVYIVFCGAIRGLGGAVAKGGHTEQ